mmetsp:Transcript_13936/g.16198  ORF Transcript_13936/g.16198 Transcript_13936/m.16198 type:complete len:233 (-) Transcript_13936:765-1463(-)
MALNPADVSGRHLGPVDNVQFSLDVGIFFFITFSTTRFFLTVFFFVFTCSSAILTLSSSDEEDEDSLSEDDDDESLLLSEDDDESLSLSELSLSELSLPDDEVLLESLSSSSSELEEDDSTFDSISFFFLFNFKIFVLLSLFDDDAGTLELIADSTRFLLTDRRNLMLFFFIEVDALLSLGSRSLLLGCRCCILDSILSLLFDFEKVELASLVSFTSFFFEIRSRSRSIPTL